jgi:hypothetical protein
MISGSENCFQIYEPQSSVELFRTLLSYLVMRNVGCDFPSDQVLVFANIIYNCLVGGAAPTFCKIEQDIPIYTSNMTGNLLA